MSGHFFLSYSRRDQEFALRLAIDLRAAGAAIWMDQVDIRPSDRWDRSIEAAVRDCTGLVLVLSPNSAASDNVLDEVAVALETGKPVIPVLIETCQIPLRLARVHQIDARNDYAGAIARCRAAMDLGASPEPREAVTPAPAPAMERLPAEVTAAVGRLLIPYLGPISPILANEESPGAASASELAERLAARIPNLADRAKFIGAVRALARS
ncbi:MAG TPA: toll/interleukin-1 receptor domain-containing protein [Caulobacteraceae bacterium]